MLRNSIDPPRGGRRWLRWSCGVLLVLVSLGLVRAQLAYEPGDLMRDTIVGADPAMLQYDEVAREFWGTEFVALARVGAFDEAAVADYRRMVGALEARLPHAQSGLLSLATLPDFVVASDGTVGYDTYLGPVDTPLADIRSTLEHDAVMRDVLFKGDDLSVLLAVAMFPQQMSDRRAYDGLVGVLEERQVAEHERLTYYEIRPTAANEAWRVIGWLPGREIISRMLPIEMVSLVSLGVLIVALVLRFSSGSWAIGFAGVLVIGVSLLWMRGSIPLIDHFVLFKERPYIIIAAANTLVTGASLVLLVTWWMRAETQEERQTLLLLGLFAFVMGEGNQLALFSSFSLRPIREMAVYAGVGLAAVAILSIVWLPLLCRRVPTDEERSNRFVTTVQRSVLWLEAHQSRRLAILVSVLALAGAVIAFPRIPRGTDILSFLHGHFFERSFNELQHDRELWADGIGIMVSPAQAREEAIYDPAFLRDAWGLLRAIEALPETRVVGGILKQVHELSRELFEKELPSTQEEAAIVFQYIDDSPMKAGARASLYSKRAFQLIGFPKLSGSSAELRGFREAVEGVGRGFPGLRLSFGGASALHARTDDLVVSGKLWNIATQFIWNCVGYGLGMALLAFYFHRRGYRSGHVSPWRLALVMNIPFVVATAGFTIVMAWAGIRLDQANASILAMASSAANDFTMYFAGKYLLEVMRSGRPAAALHATYVYKGEQVVTDVLLNCVCFLPLLLSRFKTIAELGWQTPLMLAFCAVATLWILPPFLAWTVTPQGTLSSASCRSKAS